MQAPTLIDDTGPKNRVETWMALVLTLACPLLYWTMFEHREMRTYGFALLIAIVLVTIAMSWIEQRRAKEQPKRYRRGLAWTLAAFGCVHLAIVGVLFVWGAHFSVVSRIGSTDGGTILHLPHPTRAVTRCTF